MGFFSYTCAKSHLPILASTSWGDEYSKVVVLSQDGSLLRGVYDGYGRLETPCGLDVELDDTAIHSGKLKLVSATQYAGESFADLGPSHHDPGQGHFHDEAKVKDWYKAGGFGSWSDYRAAYFAPSLEGSSSD